MATNFKTKQLISKKLLKITTLRAGTTANITTDKTLDKVLGGTTTVGEIDLERAGELVIVSGNCQTKIMCMDEAKNYFAVDAEIALNERLQFSSVADNLYGVPVVKETLVKKAGANLVDVTVVVELSIFGLGAEEITFASAGAEDFIEKTETLSFDELVGVANSKFMVEEDATINDKIDDILAVTDTVILNKITPATNYVLLEGEVVKDLCYNADGAIKQTTKTIDFAEEIALLNTMPEDKVFVELRSVGGAALPTVDETGTRTTLHLTSELLAVVITKRETTEESVVDMFNLKQNVKLSSECIYNPKFKKMLNISERDNAVVDTASQKRMDEILHLSKPVLTVLSTSANGSTVNIAGNASVEVLYKNYDADEIISANLEFPFNLSSIFSEDLQNYEIAEKLDARIIGYKNRAGKDLNLSLEFAGTLSLEQTSYDCFVNSVTEGEPVKLPKGSLTIYFAKEGESLFDIAKALRISPDSLACQNPSYTDGEAGKLVVYRTK